MEEGYTSDISRDTPRVIVVGVDGSSASLRAAAYATGVARREGATLIGVYVTQPPIVVVEMLGAELSPRSAIEDELKGIMYDELASEAASCGTDFKLVFREGVPAIEISAVASEEAADEIVVGSSRSARHRFFGSLGSRLLRKGKWVVTVVP